MKSPKHLKHKPIVSVNNYEKIDAQYRNDTDVRALSIGKAQYDINEILLKVWRHTVNRWSRQSEEIPLHRNIDLNILLLGSLMTDINSGHSKTSLREELDDIKGHNKILDYYDSHKDFLKPRLEELRNRLNEFLN